MTKGSADIASQLGDKYGAYGTVRPAQDLDPDV